MNSSFISDVDQKTIDKVHTLAGYNSDPSGMHTMAPLSGTARTNTLPAASGATKDYWSQQSDTTLAPALFSPSSLPAITPLVHNGVTPADVSLRPAGVAAVATTVIPLLPSTGGITPAEDAVNEPEEVSVQGSSQISYQDEGTTLVFVNSGGFITETDRFSGDSMTITAYRNPNLPAADWAMVGQLNDDLTGGTMSGAELTQYKAYLTEGAMSYSQLRTMVAHGSDAAAAINNVYNQVLGRNVDASGLNAYENGLGGAGMALADVRMSVAHSVEAQADIAHSYRTALGRDADAPGLSFSQNQLGAGATQATVLNSLAFSSEGIVKINSICIQAIGRIATASELFGLQNYLAAGGSLAAVQASAFNSQEAYNYQASWFRQSAMISEGDILHVYPDQFGNPTVGIGHLVLPSDGLKMGDTISQAQADAFWSHDSGWALAMARSQIGDTGIFSSSFVAALAEADFQTGNFVANNSQITWPEIVAGQYEAAALSLNNSKWYYQTPTRVENFQAALEELPQQTDY